ncbi:Ribokinase-like protein [Jimgerdemannia flammicorona]|uniref:ATP-dependent (S)-NAD(P)H-hydrate dehydratase n=1 Tax=Jimgerdemannia flammicorona TaxID=994334 RepID=A0A433QJ60_9FUNG|nr:Ribokinase-like protein [Jimgerdemannia flammicorona]
MHVCSLFPHMSELFARPDRPPIPPQIRVRIVTTALPSSVITPLCSPLHAHFLTIRLSRSYRKNKPSDLTTDEIVSSVAALFPRLHVLVIGPGLSRDTLMLDCAKGVIGKAREQDMPIVIDADGLFLIQSHPEVIRNYRKAVLTPNVVEFKRLCEHILPQNTQNSKFKSEDIATRLSQALGGVTIVQKGHEDLIANDEQVFVCDADGGLKRVGGQGDILSGAIATFLAWGKAYEENVWKHDFNIRSADIPILASYAGCSLLRETARSAYARHGRAVLTSDMIGEIGAAFTRVFGDVVDACIYCVGFRGWSVTHLDSLACYLGALANKL